MGFFAIRFFEKVVSKIFTVTGIIILFCEVINYSALLVGGRGASGDNF